MSCAWGWHPLRLFQRHSIDDASLLCMYPVNMFLCACVLFVSASTCIFHCQAEADKLCTYWSCCCPAAACSRPSIVSNSEFEADKQSLLRMLAEFQQDHPAAAAVAAVINTKATPAAPTAGPSAASTVPAAHSSIDSSSGSLLVGDQLLNDSDAVNRGMQVVMRCYERDLKSPIRNLVAGELARTLLIQVCWCTMIVSDAAIR